VRRNESSTISAVPVNQRILGHPRALISLCLALLVCPRILLGQATSQMAPSRDPLHLLSDSIHSLVERVSPTVVQIQATGYGPTEDKTPGQTNLIIGRRQAIGSGVIVDPEGYIVTNAHVVNRAESIEVIVPPQLAAVGKEDLNQDSQEKIYTARVVGIASDIDLAVIKIEAHGLPALSVRDSGHPVRQGDMVFAFGSPEGLRNTVTMGVISAVARQPDPDSPQVYVQTDTPINPGNSGGPLVNADGELVGINTFIFSTSGGNQGLGFAIPAGVVTSAYPQLLKYGHVHQPTIGVLVQTVTPDLAAGLHLDRNFGVLVSDVIPSGPADVAGMKIQDIILGVNGMPTGTLPLFAHSLNLHRSGDHVRIEVLRGTERQTLDVILAEKPHKEDSLADLADPVKNLVRPLNLLGVELTPELVNSLSDLRISTGVIVVARTQGSRTSEIPLQTGDVIHSLNGTTITTLDGLREALSKAKVGDAIALQIERYGQLYFIAFIR
jgi:serine protease Do